MVLMIISLVLGVIPLLGIGYMLASGGLLTVDGLFMSIIALTLSGVLFLNAFLEFRDLRKKAEALKPSGGK